MGRLFWVVQLQFSIFASLSLMCALLQETSLRPNASILLIVSCTALAFTSCFYICSKGHRSSVTAQFVVLLEGLVSMVVLLAILLRLLLPED